MKFFNRLLGGLFGKDIIKMQQFIHVYAETIKYFGLEKATNTMYEYIGKKNYKSYYSIPDKLKDKYIKEVGQQVKEVKEFVQNLENYTLTDKRRTK